MALLLTTLATLAFAASLNTPNLSKRQTLVRSPNYSGAVLSPSPDGTPFTYATTQINVPSTIFITSETSPGTLQKSAAWVGFGGGTHGSGIIQTGCTFFNDGEGDQYTRCWHEFFPDPPVFYDGFSPSAGDTVQLEITRSDDVTGHSTITNLSTGEQVAADFSAPAGASCAGSDADWVVENPGGQPNLVDFQVQFFEGCVAHSAAGGVFGPGSGSYRLFNEFKDLGDGQGMTKWTNSFLPSESEVEVDWVGPS